MGQFRQVSAPKKIESLGQFFVRRLAAICNPVQQPNLLRRVCAGLPLDTLGQVLRLQQEGLVIKQSQRLSGNCSDLTPLAAQAGVRLVEYLEHRVFQIALHRRVNASSPCGGFVCR